ncbi:MAG: hypothetical protein AB7L91_19065 [Dehalococcoidia bacterium]
MPQRIKLPVTGPLDGPRAVDLPTFWDLKLDDDGASAWVTVPDEDAPTDDEQSWHAQLDARYREHAGEFRPHLSERTNAPEPAHERGPKRQG